MPLVQNVGRWEINTGKHMKIDMRTAVIQITDTDLDFPALKEAPFRSLGLRFLDVEEAEWPAMHINGQCTINDAREIASIIRMAKIRGWNLLAQCEMGVSRSGAVAQAAIEYGFEEAPGSLQRDPNMRLLTLLRNELGTAYEPQQSPFKGTDEHPDN